MSCSYQEPLNHGRFETWNIKPEFDFMHAHQVHGVRIASEKELPCEADGLVSSWKDLEKPLAIKTADCMPIVIEGSKGVVFLHAGWRGLADGILKDESLKNVEPQRVLIGPSIHDCCFEVSADFKTNFPNSPFFKKRSAKLFFSLQDEAKRQLQEIFPGLLVDISPMCTSCHAELHSYRKTKTTERNWNLYIKG
jgi:YfiH family protein